MLVKDIVDEDFQNYKKPSMFISAVNCTWKCCEEANIPRSVCQNSEIAKQKNIKISAEEILRRYQNNSITQAIVIGGLEPMLQYEDIFDLLYLFRANGVDDDFVIYTGYYYEEISAMVDWIRMFRNVVFKFGRYIPDNEKHFDEVLGVELASDNQYAERIS